MNFFGDKIALPVNPIRPLLRNAWGLGLWVGSILGLSPLAVYGLEPVEISSKTPIELYVVSPSSDLDKIIDQNLDWHLNSRGVAQNAIEPTPNPNETPQNLPPATVNSSPESSNKLEELRRSLRIRPKVKIEAYQSYQSYSPSLSAGIPSAFGANWGDAFVSASGATPGKERKGQVDGSLSMGLGVGNSRDLASVTLAYNLGSINNFGQNGTFDLQGSRVVYADNTHQVAIAAGWSAFAQYGNEGIIPSTVWGGITSVSLLQPEDEVNKLPLLLSVGVGGGYFSEYQGTNAYGGLGLQVAPQLGLGLAWSGVGLNVGVSFVPIPSIPLTLNAIGGDLGDTSAGGRRLVLSISYGYNFLPQNY